MSLARTSLAFIEEKLQRLLGLAGDIKATFTPEIRPQIVMADLADPLGVSSFRGRHFAYASELFTVGAANTTWGLRFAVPCIVESMWVAGAPFDGGGAGVPARLPVHAIAPSVAAGANPFPTLLVQGGTWVDNKLTESDQPPLYHGPSGAPQTGTAGAFAQLSVANRIWVFGQSGGSILAGWAAAPLGRGIHFAANGEIRVDTTKIGTGSQYTFGIKGRIA